MEINAEDKVREILNTVLDGLSEEFEIKNLEVKDNPRQGLIKVFIDKPGGITVEDCTRISKEFSVHLDISDPLQGPYRLVVSSPGIEEEGK
ncbi:hypothetical protein KAW18_06805 [candidate division WOR-3 bacterium]|nr:hypothetical protein [candidate division WOR-3 bacterium]MCK4527064.1 hypothetical protein [candidate division WOR-3 bacterium]